ncbi:hypothetical protein FQN54_008355 [Arachnomyces sp. PD_36]|nr:hypothetical protein FQN54_008355 [Arachnomyces sp. PD_36]
MKLSLLSTGVIASASQVASASLASKVNSALTPFGYTPQVLRTFLEPIDVLVGRNSYITREGAELQLNGERWTAGGANVYWLGLDENVVPPPGEPFYEPTNSSYPTKGRITEVMNTMQALGGRTIRSQSLGVSVGNPLSLMPALGEWNEEAFETIDWTMYQARQHGIRIQMPLVDNYDYYHGGKFNFLRFRGIDIDSEADVLDPRVQQFYTNETIIGDFKSYIKKLITHVNPYTGLTYAEDPTVFAFETGNELSGPIFGDMDVPIEWTSDILNFVKDLAPHKLMVDGTYGVNQTHLDIPVVDIFSDHFYGPDNEKLQKGIDLVESVDKVYMVGEFDWTGNNPEADTLDDFFGLIEDRQELPNPVVSGTQLWSIFTHNVPDCESYVDHSDGYTLQYGNPANTEQNNTQIATVRKHLHRLKGETVGDYLPAVPCPGPLAEYTYE